MSRPGGSADLLTDQQVDIIAARLAERLTGSPAGGTQVPAARSGPVVAPRAAPGEGIFATVDEAVDSPRWTRPSTQRVSRSANSTA
jgi:hypothetical protein